MDTSNTNKIKTRETDFTGNINPAYERLDARNDKFWIQDPSILIDKNRYIEFFPTQDMTPIEKLNSIARFTIMFGVLLFLYQGKTWPLYIPLFGLAFTIFLFYSLQTAIDPPTSVTLQKQIQKLDENDVEFTNVTYKKNANDEWCVPPSQDNPFSNVLLSDYVIDPERPKACPYDKKTLDNYFYYNVYRDSDDIFEKNNGQRQFFTMPYTTIPNEQGKFAEWLYKTPKTCKEDPTQCAGAYPQGSTELRSQRPVFVDPLRNPVITRKY